MPRSRSSIVAKTELLDHADQQSVQDEAPKDTVAGQKTACVTGDDELAITPSFSDEFNEQLAELIHWRRDVRRFKGQDVSQGILEELLALADHSPSVGNSQPWRWVHVKSQELRRKVQEDFQAQNEQAAAQYDTPSRAHYNQLKLAGLKEAPVQYAVFCEMDCEQGRGLGRNTMPEMLQYSAVLSVHTFWLAARARGLGVGWVSILDPSVVTRLLDVPDSWRLIAYLCVGWPVEQHIDPELARANWQQRTPLKIYDR